MDKDSYVEYSEDYIRYDSDEYIKYVKAIAATTPSLNDVDGNYLRLYVFYSILQMRISDHIFSNKEMLSIGHQFIHSMTSLDF
jgi:hypothetical protein